jgi:hypothetical protein
MTHSLHRKGTAEDICDDYVMLVMAGRERMKNEIVQERMNEVWDILSRHEAALTNFGSIRGGGRHKQPIEAFKRKKGMLIHAVFKDRESLRACLVEIKGRDLGISIAISGCDEEVRETCAELDLAPHTVQYSLGIHGKQDKLPDEDVLAIATMCGHAMVSTRLIGHVIDRIGKGKMTHVEAAARLASMCDCGIFNPHRAERLLRTMV